MFFIEDSKLFVGCPIPLDSTCLVYPLTIIEIIAMGENKYRFLLNLLTMSNEDLVNMFEEKKVTPPEDLNIFDYIMANCALDVNFLLDIKNAFFTFIREQVQILPEDNCIVVGELEEKRIINKDNFLNFQNILRAQNRIKIPEEIPENENEMQKKFRLRRYAVERAKKKQAMKNGEEAISLSTLMSAFLIYNPGVSLEEMKELSLYAFYKILDMEREKEKYDYDMQAILAGADPKKVKTEYWIRNNI